MNRLKIGLMLNSFVQPAWVAAILDQLLEADFVEISLIIRRESGLAEERQETLLRTLINRRKELAYLAYRRLDHTIFPYAPDAFQSVDVSAKLSGVREITVTPLRKRFSERFPPEAVEVIRSCELDVILRLGFGILRGDVLQAARHGVWSFHHGDPARYRGGPAGFWEVMERSPTTGAMLQALTEELDNGQVLCRCRYRTHPWSVNRNLNAYYWKAVPFVMRSLGHLARTSEPPTCTPGNYEPYQSRLYKVPTNWQTFKSVAGLAIAYTSHKARSVLRSSQWTVGYSLTKDFPNTFYKFKLLTPPHDRFWADPFPLLHEGRHFIFIEELLYKRKLGHLSVIPINSDGSAGDPIRILEREYHLSYPQIFRWRGELFLVPETARNQTLDVYRCRSFPDQWEHYATVMEGVKIVDATFYQQDGRWWLFAGMSRTVDAKDEELYLFSSTTPLGPWREHPANPIKSDICSARPAGWLFSYQGQLYRPAQDLSRGENFQIAVNRVDTFTDSEYRETEHARLRGGWLPNLLGIHTINHADGLAVIDVNIRKPPF